jgi:sialate O-acetylesterase
MIKPVVTVLLLLHVTPCLADLRLPKVLSSHMVLQQNSEVKIWGWADAGEPIVVSGDWLDAKTRITADANGRWQVSVKTGNAGGPHTLTIVGKNRIQLDDVLFGEVWVGSGQSNMEMPLIKVSEGYTGIQDAAKEVAAASYPRIRLFQAGNFSSKEPLADVETGTSMHGVPPADCKWRACTPRTVPTFSSTAYFFARELHRQLEVPIGIIDASWGGTAAEAWTPASGLKKLGYAAELEEASRSPQEPGEKIPTRLYNGMIHPLRNFKIKGVVWYQGESNAKRADKYQELFATMISEWRAVFGYEFLFCFVQLAPWSYGAVNAAYLREAQLQTLSLPKTGMAVTMDIGNLTDIHPKNKQEVGRRLALWTLQHDYGKDLIGSGPIFKDSKVEEGSVRLRFDHVGSGLVTHNGESPSHFEVAGNDKVFHPATAVIDGDALVVSSDKVAEPLAVRYAFTSDAMPNLTNKEGLPASPFRTDRW